MNKFSNRNGAISTGNYVYNFHFHLVFCTKYRKAIFTTPELVTEMKTLLTNAAERHNITIEQMEVMKDHVHMLISFKPKYAPSEIVKKLKGNVSYYFFKNHPEIKAEKLPCGKLWTHSYYMSTLGNMSKSVVEDYIKRQYDEED